MLLEFLLGGSFTMALIKCPKCQHELNSDRKCTNCGTDAGKYERTLCKNCDGEIKQCPKCQQEIHQDEAVCSSCGYDVQKIKKTICIFCDQKDNTVDADQQVKQRSLIECPDCGGMVSINAKVCIHCGRSMGEINSKDAKHSTKVRSKHRTAKIGIAIAIVCILLIGSIILYAHFNSPTAKMTNYLEKGDIQKAQAIFDDELENKKNLSKTQKQAFKALDYTLKQYTGNSEKDKNYTNVLDFITKNFSSTDEIETLIDSKEAFKTGKNYARLKNYDLAIKSYSQVIKEDELYNDAQQEIQNCQDDFKDKIIAEIDKQLSLDNPTIEAVQKDIDSYDFLQKDSDVKKKLSSLKEEIKQKTFIRVNELAEKQEYQLALDLLKARIPSNMAEDKEIQTFKKDLVSKFINWTNTESDKYIEKGRYDKAISLLKSCEVYDNEKILADKTKEVNAKFKQINIKKFKKLKKTLTIKYDSVNRDYTVVNKGYSVDYINLSSTINIEARASINKQEKTVDFSLVAGFAQEDWIFTDAISIVAGKYKDVYMVDYLDRYTQVDYGMISEWMYFEDLLSTGEVLNNSGGLDMLLNNITTSKKATMRFSGKGHGSRDHIITNGEKENIKNVRQFCDMLEKYEYLYKYV